MKKINPVLVAGIILIFVAFLLLVIGTSTGGWVKITSTYLNSDSGISYGLSYFQDFPYGQATKAFAVLSILASIGALTAIIVYLVFDLLDKMNDKFAKLPIITHVVAVVGAAFAGISIVIFAAEVYPTRNLTLTFTPDYSWVLVLIGGLFLEAGGFLCHKANKLSKIDASA